MFTGIVEEIGILSKIENINSGEKLITIKCKKILKPKNLITRPLKDLTKESILNMFNSY